LTPPIDHLLRTVWPGLPELSMRFNGNFYSEWTHVRRDFRRTLFAALVACVLGGTASAAVILSLVGSLMIQPVVPSISSRVPVRNTNALETANIVQDRSTIEPPTPRAVISAATSHSEGPAVQTEAGHQGEAHGHQSRKYSRVVVGSRQHYWRWRFAHSLSQAPRFSSW